MLRSLVALAGLSFALGPCGNSGGGGGGNSGGATDADAAVGAACAQSLSVQCTPTPASGCKPSDICGPSGIPSGLGCSNEKPCEMDIDPCPNWQKHVGGETVDYWACACVDGAWACGLCAHGASTCIETDAGTAEAGGD